ncbi:hypothetical protein VF13_37990, partial [Nostoc linckia z16]
LYYYRNSKTNRREKLRALALYRRAQTNSLKLQDILSLYILANECYNDTFREGKTFGEYLAYLQRNHEDNLSEANYIRIRNGNSRSFRKKIIAAIEAENTKLAELRSHLSSLREAVV